MERHRDKMAADKSEREACGILSLAVSAGTKAADSHLGSSLAVQRLLLLKPSGLWLFASSVLAKAN